MNERIVTESDKEGANIQFIKIIKMGRSLLVGGSIDACYEISEDGVIAINKYDFWSVLVVQDLVYIGGFKEIVVYNLKTGCILKAIKTKNYVYCMS